VVVLFACVSVVLKLAPQRARCGMGCAYFTRRSKSSLFRRRARVSSVRIADRNTRVNSSRVNALGLWFFIRLLLPPVGVLHSDGVVGSSTHSF
jgi:hypothetical protein